MRSMAATHIGLTTVLAGTMALGVLHAQLRTLSEIPLPALAPRGVASLVTSRGGGPEAVTFDGKFLWVAEQFSNTVSRLDPLTAIRLGTVDVGERPVALLSVGTTLWVANLGSHTLTKLRTSDGAVVGTFKAGDGPGGLAYDGVNLWVANRNSDTIDKMSGQGRDQRKSVAVVPTRHSFVATSNQHPTAAMFLGRGPHNRL